MQIIFQMNYVPMRESIKTICLTHGMCILTAAVAHSCRQYQQSGFPVLLFLGDLMKLEGI